MPQTKNAIACRAYKQRQREKNEVADRRRRAARTRSQTNRKVPTDPVDTVAAWCKRRLKIPVGHALAGQPMALPKFATSFLRDALQPDCHSAYLLVARKNSKSASLAAFILAYLADGGPLRKAGFRCAVVSITKPKAAELKQQCQDIAEASGLRGLTFKKSPAPGRIESKWGSCEVLSAQDYEGHASGFDLVLIDELGLFPERYRALLAGLKSSLVAKRGRMISLSIRGDSPFTDEALARKGDPGIVVHHHAGLEGCELDDEQELKAANPGIESGILRLDDLVRDAREAQKTPANIPYFQAHHLNQRQNPSVEMLCNLADWKACLRAYRAD